MGTHPHLARERQRGMPAQPDQRLTRQVRDRASARRRRAARAPTRQDVTPMRDDPAVTALVTRARNGDKQAWDTLVERYAPLIWSICRSQNRPLPRP